MSYANRRYEPIADTGENSLNILRRKLLLPALTFLVGTAVGLMVAGYNGKLREPVDEVERADIANRPNPQPAAEADGPSAETVASAASLNTAVEQSLATEGDTVEGKADLESRLQAMNAAWSGLQADLARLRGRVEGLERKLATPTATSGTNGAAVTQPPRSRTLQDRRAALVVAGVGEDRAANLVWRQGQLELDRLELRDIAIREGWFGSDRYREERGLIDEDALDLRQEIGDDFYDRYLFAAGEDNRVEIGSIIPGSTAEGGGLQPGDLVEYYGGSRIFTARDLRTATTEGERGELVQVRIRRRDGVVDAWLPRGPLGVRLEPVVVDPDS